MKKERQLVYFDHQDVNSLCSCHHYVNSSCCVSIELYCNSLQPIGMHIFSGLFFKYKKRLIYLHVFRPQLKGLSLSNSDVIRQVHNSFARFGFTPLQINSVKFMLKKVNGNCYKPYRRRIIQALIQANLKEI